MNTNFRSLELVVTVAISVIGKQFTHVSWDHGDSESSCTLLFQGLGATVAGSVIGKQQHV